MTLSDLYATSHDKYQQIQLASDLGLLTPQQVFERRKKIGEEVDSQIILILEKAKDE